MEREKKRAGSGKGFLSGGRRIVENEPFDVTGFCVVWWVAVVMVVIWAAE